MPKPKKRTPPGRPAPAADPEQAHDDAMRVLRAEYYSGVRGIVQDLKERIASKEIDSDDALNDAVHQAVDGSYWVIYTHANFQVLLCSDHHDAYSEEYDEAPVEGSDIKWAALAYAALERDVRDQMGAEGVEVVEERGVREARRPRGGWWVHWNNKSENGPFTSKAEAEHFAEYWHGQDPKLTFTIDQVAGWDERMWPRPAAREPRRVSEPRRLDSRLREPGRRATAARRPRGQ